MARPQQNGRVSNYVLNARLEEVEKKVDKMDTRMWFILIGVAGGVVIQLLKALHGGLL